MKELDDNEEEAKKLWPNLFKQLRSYTDIITKKFGDDGFYEYDEIITNLESAEDFEEFNNYWNDLYDFCDSNSIWLKTF